MDNGVMGSDVIDSSMRFPLAIIALAALVQLTACTTSYNPLDDYEELRPTTMVAAPDARTGESGLASAEQVERGKYLVELMGCGTCHTHGALIGEPDMGLRLAGSGIGIAYSNPLAGPNPGVAYPSNLTPDPNTGLGGWNDQQIAAAIRHGEHRYGKRLLTVMPWPAFARLSDDDTLAIAAYLRSLPPTEHHVPENVAQGYKASDPFVYFGVYRNRRD